MLNFSCSSRDGELPEYQKQKPPEHHTGPSGFLGTLKQKKRRQRAHRLMGSSQDTSNVGENAAFSLTLSVRSGELVEPGEYIGLSLKSAPVVGRDAPNNCCTVIVAKDVSKYL